MHKVIYLGLRNRAGNWSDHRGYHWKPIARRAACNGAESKMNNTEMQKSILRCSAAKKHPSRNLSGNTFIVAIPNAHGFLFANRLTKTNRTLKWNQRNTFFSFFSAALEWVVFTWRHSRHVGAQKKREKCLSIIMQNMSHNLLLFCAPARPSYHVIENHLYLLHWDLLSKTH